MKLIGSLTSPYVRKVRIALAEKKLDYEMTLDSPWVEQTLTPQFNPLGKVPVLVLKDGYCLYDSRVIVEYVDNLTPSNKLIPANGRERIHVLRWEALADGICDAAAAAFLEAKRPAKQQSKEWIERQLGKIRLGLQAASSELKDGQWCNGLRLSLADIALGVALGYLDFRFSDIQWREQYPNLEQLSAKLATRQTFIDTMPQL